LRVKFPFLQGATVIADNGIAGSYPALMVQEAKLPVFYFVHCIHLLHELKYPPLFVAVRGNCRAYGNYFTQVTLFMIIMRKQTVVQAAASTFIFRLFLKLACCSFFQTLIIHSIKNHTIGPMHAMNR
jgi:hypothetical protein